MPNANYIFIFQISAYDPDRLLPQVRKALEKITELLSRKRFPRRGKPCRRGNLFAPRM